MKIKHILTKTTVNEGVLDDVRARMDARRNPAAVKPTATPAAQPAAPVVSTGGFKVGDTVDFGVGVPKPKVIQQGTITAIQGPVTTVTTADGQTYDLDSRMKSSYMAPSPKESSSFGIFGKQAHGQNRDAWVAKVEKQFPTAEIALTRTPNGPAKATLNGKVVASFPETQGLDEADEWEEDTDKHRRFIDYAKKILMRERDPKRRIESANYLSKQENKFFGSPISSSTEDMPFGSVNTGKAFTDLIKGIMTDIESGRLHYEQQALSAAIWLEPEGKAFLKKAYNDFVKMADYSRREREQHAIALSGYQIANLGGRVVGSLKGGIVNDPTASMTPEILGVHELAEKEIQRINGEKEDEAERQRNIAMWNALPMPLKIAAAAAVGKTPAQMEKIILAKDEIEAIAALSPSDFPNLRQQAAADDEDDFDDTKKPMAEIKESQSAELKSLLKSAGISQRK